MQLRSASIAILLATSMSPLTSSLLRAEGTASGAENKDIAAKHATSAQMAARIDTVFEGVWSADHIKPAPPATDGEFLRRAYLDLNGVIPRRPKCGLSWRMARPTNVCNSSMSCLIRHAIRRTWPPFGGTGFCRSVSCQNVDPQAAALQKWLRTRFAKNLRYDNLVGELLLTLGGDELGPALYYQANDVMPEKLATSTAELFLGVHLHCAQCHDHPTADWTQRDFWGLAAFFARVRAADDRNGMMGMSYRLIDTDQGDVRIPKTQEIVPPKYPGGDVAKDDGHARGGCSWRCGLHHVTTSTSLARP